MFLTFLMYYWILPLIFSLSWSRQDWMLSGAMTKFLVEKIVLQICRSFWDVCRVLNGKDQQAEKISFHEGCRSFDLGSSGTSLICQMGKFFFSRFEMIRSALIHGEEIIIFTWHGPLMAFDYKTKYMFNYSSLMICFYGGMNQD